MAALCGLWRRATACGRTPPQEGGGAVEGSVGEQGMAGICLDTVAELGDIRLVDASEHGECGEGDQELGGFASPPETGVGHGFMTLQNLEQEGKDDMLSRFLVDQKYDGEMASWKNMVKSLRVAQGGPGDGGVEAMSPGAGWRHMLRSGRKRKTEDTPPPSGIPGPSTERVNSEGCLSVRSAGSCEGSRPRYAPAPGAARKSFSAAGRRASDETGAARGAVDLALGRGQASPRHRARGRPPSTTESVASVDSFQAQSPSKGGTFDKLLFQEHLHPGLQL
mmetsp:Transcript_40772/g.130104  ORF Transcript_40772/g.130104 Transcript_40772/m.130104 type:complete len:279 (-) Transcript_40772:555-1391(-)